MNICVIGAGYVGLITSLSLAKKNNKVICIDKDKSKIEKLNNGITTIYEKGLGKLLNECLSSNNILFTNDMATGVKNSDIIYIAVGTPQKTNWDVDMTQVYEVINQISDYINNYKVIVNKSTVPVGTQKETKNILIKNNVSSKYFDVVSNPEFLREGKAIEDFFNPDRIVIGYDSLKAKNIMKKIYKPFNSKIIFTTPETAELIKYASNAFLATKISFVNELANLCTKVGADIETVSYAMGFDKRISPHFLKAGIGFGGSCFPKDTRALVKTGEKFGCDFKIVKSAIEVNEIQKTIPIKYLLEKYNEIKGKIISILGLTFKPDTDDIREAPSLSIIETLLDKGAIVKCYDPKASIEIKDLFPNVEYCENLYDSLINSDCAIICTEWDEFKSLDLKKVKSLMKSPMIIDGRNMLNLSNNEKEEFDYISIGKNSNDDMKI